jgi:hypothetical protein
MLYCFTNWKLKDSIELPPVVELFRKKTPSMEFEDVCELCRFRETVPAVSI